MGDVQMANTVGLAVGHKSSTKYFPCMKHEQEPFFFVSTIEARPPTRNTNEKQKNL